MRRLHIVSHDAGGAEIISEWLLLQHPEEWGVTFQLSGPAVRIFAEKMIINSDDLCGPDLVLCGSGSSWERTGVEAANASGIRSVVWLDHWTNYSNRFWNGDDYVMPTEVWVCDKYAEAKAKEVLPIPPNRVINKGNPYLESFATGIAAESAPGDMHSRILWIGEVGRRREFRHYLRELELRARAGTKTVLRIRPHPAEPRAGYLPYLGRPTAAYGAELSKPGVSLAEDLSWAQTVAGADSMGLVAGLYAGKHVVSVLPASEASIPYPEIERPA